MFNNPEDLINKIPKAEFSKAFISKFLRENPIIIEAGAHIGRDTVKFAKSWPRSEIYAFEPVPELYQKLKENTKNFSNIKTYKLALSDSHGETIFHVSSGRSTALSSLYQPLPVNLAKHPEIVFNQISVLTTTLDSWAVENNIKKIDFIWFDLQGAELRALVGAEHILKTTQILLIEGSLKQRYLGEPLIDELANWLEERNFKAIFRDELKHNKINVIFKTSKFN